MSNRPVTIDVFVDELAAIPPEEFTLAGVLEFLKTHPVNDESLKPFLYFKANTYTRNLIFKNSLFEVLALCWDIGKTSHIHNHCDQQCWMAAPIGKLFVQNYQVVAGSEKGPYCKLEPTDHYWMDGSSPGVVRPEEPIHSVANPPDTGARAVSIHVYSRPYDRCMVYSLDKNEAWEIRLSYDTEYGVASVQDA